MWSDTRYGAYEYGPMGRAALCAAALLRSGEQVDSRPVISTLNELMGLETGSTRSRALRLSLLSSLPPSRIGPEERTAIEADLAWLLAAAGPEGDFAVDDAAAGRGDWDNYSSYLAARAVLSAAQAGFAVPDAFWRAIVRHWNNRRQGDGGWAFDDRQRGSYGSITAGGLAVLLGATARLDGGAIVTGPQASNAFPDVSIKWLADNFSPWLNPGRGPQYYHRWAMALNEAASIGGYATLGGRDWRGEIASRLLATQRFDGGWGDPADTAMALMVLADLRVPVLFGKLRYPGRWNARRFDVAELSDRLSRRFERRVRWLLVDVDAPVETWRDAPVLVISGAAAPSFTDGQIARLRRYVLDGGMLLSVAVGDNPAFNVAMRRVYERLLPGRTLRDLPREHPVYHAYRDLTRPATLQGVSNGVRLLAIHCPTDISADWLAPTGGGTADGDEGFYIAANAYLHVTDFGAFETLADPDGTPAPSIDPAALDAAPGGVVKIVLVTPGGGEYAEPAALPRFAELMSERMKLNVEIVGPVAPAFVPLDGRTLAIFSGTGEFRLSDEDRAALRNFISAGGLLLATAAGGEDGFDAAVRVELLDGLLSDSAPIRTPLAPDGEILAMPGLPVGKVGYRRAARAIYGQADEPKLTALTLNGRPALIYSRDDIIASLVGYRGFDLRGYDSDSAYRILRNLAVYAASREEPDGAILRNEVQVQWMGAGD